MNTQLIDTHCHLYLDAFSDDIQQVMDRAIRGGIGIMLPAIDSTELENLLKLEKTWPKACFAMMGLHPCSVKENYKEELELVKTWLAKRKFIAVGEIGLDYYWDKTFIKDQKAAFSQQIEWALQYDLPIVIHSRNAIEDCITMVKEQQSGKLKGIFHCFSDDRATADRIIEMGFYLGIGGVLTYKNSGLAEVIKDISLEHIVLETDAPYLTPVPFRGKRNESSYIKYVAAKLSDIKGISVQEVAAITTKNAQKIFGI